MGAVAAAIKDLTDAQILDFEKSGTLSLAGHTIEAGEIKVWRGPRVGRGSVWGGRGAAQAPGLRRIMCRGDPPSRVCTTLTAMRPTSTPLSPHPFLSSVTSS